jgi:phosphoribosylformylglycinamidine (FGAM) synthase-like enzyme
LIQLLTRQQHQISNYLLNKLGLKADEYENIKGILGRRPTGSELAMYSVMWSEHCSYKSSKVHLKQFGEKAPKSDALLVGIGENAGVVDIGQGYAVTFKAESHNHPSFVEPVPRRSNWCWWNRSRYFDDGRSPNRCNGSTSFR